MIVKILTILLVVFVSHSFAEFESPSRDCQKIKNMISKEYFLDRKQALYEKAITYCKNDYQVLYNYSVLLHKNKKFKESKTYLREAIKVKDSANARLLLAKNYYKLNNDTLAKSEYRVARKKDKNNENIVRDEFYSLVKEGAYEKALKFEKQLLDSNNNLKEDYYNLAICNEKAGNITKAISFLEKSLSLDTSYQKAYYNLGLLYSSQNNFDKAEKMLLKSNQLSPRHIQTLRQLAKIYDSSNHEKQKSVIDKILQIEPNDYYANKKKGFYAYKAKNMNNAMKYFETAISTKEDANILNAMGMIYLSEEKLEKAKKVFSRGLYLEKYNSPKFFNNLGLAYLKQKNNQYAKKMFKKALYIDKDYKFAKSNLKLLENSKGI